MQKVHLKFPIIVFAKSLFETYHIEKKKIFESFTEFFEGWLITEK